MTEFIGGIDYSKQRINDDALHAPNWMARFGKELSFYYNAVTATLPPRRYLESPVDEYWKETGILLPADRGVIYIGSRASFNYPLVRLQHTKLPTLESGREWYIGVEEGPSPLTGIVALSGHDINAYFVVGTWQDFARGKITNLLPSDYDTSTNNEYSIKVNKCYGELYIQDVLKAVGLFGMQNSIPRWENNPPYTLFGCRSPILASRFPLFIEMVRSGANIDDWIWALNPRFATLGFAAGDPLPPRQYSLYTENTGTKWNGLTTSTPITSHPVPVWGYPRKTLLFQANAAGTLAIQVYAGGAWREWASITLTANTLEVYNLNGEFPIARGIYTPVGTDTIAVAEWMMGGD